MCVIIIYMCVCVLLIIDDKQGFYINYFRRCWERAIVSTFLDKSVDGIGIIIIKIYKTRDKGTYVQITTVHKARWLNILWYLNRYREIKRKRHFIKKNAFNCVVLLILFYSFVYCWNLYRGLEIIKMSSTDYCTVFSVVINATFCSHNFFLI